tara:strand:- start:58 stop:183 length:126 start_codon:yes stop_codon:yes gene_type:complete
MSKLLISEIKSELDKVADKYMKRHPEIVVFCEVHKVKDIEE